MAVALTSLLDSIYLRIYCIKHCLHTQQSGRRVFREYTVQAEECWGFVYRFRV